MKSRCWKWLVSILWCRCDTASIYRALRTGVETYTTFTYEVHWHRVCRRRRSTASGAPTEWWLSTWTDKTPSSKEVCLLLLCRRSCPRSCPVLFEDEFFGASELPIENATMRSSDDEGTVTGLVLWQRRLRQIVMVERGWAVKQQ